MIESRRRISLLGLLALLGGLAALLLTKFNPTPWQTVPIGTAATVPLGTVVAIAAAALSLIAFARAAASPRTGTALPAVSILVCAAAVVLALKPNLFRARSAPAGPPAAPLAARPTTPDAAIKPDRPAPAPHVKTIFDNDFPSSSSTPPATPSRDGSAAASAPVPARAASPASPPRAQSTAAMQAARAKLEAARAHVVRSLESSDDYRAAKSDADAVDAALKDARRTCPPGSSALIAADKAAIEAHKKLQKLINDDAARDPAYQDAERELRSAQAASVRAQSTTIAP
jgi:hypothetical protein